MHTCSRLRGTYQYNYIRLSRVPPRDTFIQRTRPNRTPRTLGLCFWLNDYRILRHPLTTVAVGGPFPEQPPNIAEGVAQRVRASRSLYRRRRKEAEYRGPIYLQASAHTKYLNDHLTVPCPSCRAMPVPFQTTHKQFEQHPGTCDAGGAAVG